MEPIVRVVTFPTSKVRGVVVYDNDGMPNIYINAILSKDEQMKALDHELNHIYKDDIFNGEPIRYIEKMA